MHRPPYTDTARRIGLAGHPGAWHADRPPQHVSLGGHVTTAMATRDADLPNQGNCVDGRAGEEGALSVRRAAVRNTDVTFGPADPACGGGANFCLAEPAYPGAPNYCGVDCFAGQEWSG